MALTRVWIPSPNYSNGSTKRLLVLHTTEGFTGPNGAYDCAKYFQGNVGASSQVCIDNNRGKVWECVGPTYGSWTQCQYNSVSVSAEQCGYASYSREKWLNEFSNLLHNTADWLAEESKRFGIPLVKLSPSSAQGGGKGICYHSDLGSAGCGHSDPGNGYPIDKVIEWAKGGTSSPATGGIFMTAASVYWQEKLYMACIGTDKRVYYRGPDDPSWAMVDKQSAAKSGVDITASTNGKLAITYVNTSGNVCYYEKARGGSSWVWVNKAGNALLCFKRNEQIDKEFVMWYP